MEGERTILCGKCGESKPIPKTLFFIDGKPLCSRRCTGPKIVEPEAVEPCNAKITVQEVKAIRSSDLSGKELSEKYNLSQPAISKIKSRKTWRYV